MPKSRDCAKKRIHSRWREIVGKEIQNFHLQINEKLGNCLHYFLHWNRDPIHVLGILFQRDGHNNCDKHTYYKNHTDIANLKFKCLKKRKN